MSLDLDDIRHERDALAEQLSAVRCELDGEPVLHYLDRTDPRWTPTLQEAGARRAQIRELAAQVVELIGETRAQRERIAELEAELARTRGVQP